MARLHDSRRPLVVSFRRKRSQQSPRKSKQVIVLDNDLQDALDTLQAGEPPRARKEFAPKAVPEGLSRDCSFVEVHNLRPTHICPLSADMEEYCKSDDVDMFQITLAVPARVN